MGWQYQHQWWRDELERLGIRQSMSRKGNCLDNAAAEQVFGHLKDEFYRGREFDSFERFKAELDAYIVHWNTRRRQIRLEGRTPEEFRSMSLWGHQRSKVQIHGASELIQAQFSRVKIRMPMMDHEKQN